MTKAPSPPKISEEEVNRYFASTDPLPTVSSPVNNHLERVNAALEQGIPTDREATAALRASLFKLASFPEIPSAKREVFRQIALQLNEVTHLYLRSRDCYDLASADLKRLQDLQSRRTGLQDNFLKLEGERIKALQRK